MLFAVIGGAVVAAVIVVTVYLQYTSSLTVPPKDLRRKWRAGR
ncbi:MAG TPA: hypothetical protein VK599_15135 [Streptosporangiaceae bacterium]|nr:hypothetical protein [Streptosporangiaceae bacterium]